MPNTHHSLHCSCRSPFAGPLFFAKPSAPSAHRSQTARSRCLSERDEASGFETLVDRNCFLSFFLLLNFASTLFVFYRLFLSLAHRLLFGLHCVHFALFEFTQRCRLPKKKRQECVLDTLASLAFATIQNRLGSSLGAHTLNPPSIYHSRLRVTSSMQHGPSDYCFQICFRSPNALMWIERFECSSDFVNQKFRFRTISHRNTLRQVA